MITDRANKVDPNKFFFLLLNAYRTYYVSGFNHIKSVGKTVG
jgi:hypothetical protein